MRDIRFRKLTLLLAFLLIFGLILTACAGADEEEPTPTETAGTVEEATPEEAMPAEELAVGIVLPTRDEPRWIQDETRFQDAT